MKDVAKPFACFSLVLFVAAFVACAAERSERENNSPFCGLAAPRFPLIEKIPVDNLLTRNEFILCLPKYGRYEVHLVLHDKFNGGEIHDMPPTNRNRLAGTITILDSEKSIILAREFDWDVYYGFGGATVFYVRTPEEVPKKQELTIAVDFAEIPDRFADRYHSVGVSVKKSAVFLK